IKLKMGNELSFDNASGEVPPSLLRVLGINIDSQDNVDETSNWTSPVDLDYVIENDELIVKESNFGDGFVVLDVAKRNATAQPNINNIKADTPTETLYDKSKSSGDGFAEIDANKGSATESLNNSNNSKADAPIETIYDKSKSSGDHFVTKYDNFVGLQNGKNKTKQRNRKGHRQKQSVKVATPNTIDNGIDFNGNDGENNNRCSATEEKREGSKPKGKTTKNKCQVPNKNDYLKTEERNAFQAAVIEKMTEGSSLWRRKMVVCFNALDQTGDGFIQKEDFQDMIRRIESRYQLSGRSMSDLRRHGLSFVLIEVLWSTVLTAGNDQGPDYKISLEEFIRILHTYFAVERYKEYLRVTITHCAEHIYDILDCDHEGGIDVNRYKHFLEIFGAKDDVADNGFEDIDADHTGEISRFEFIDAYTDFWMNQELGCGALLLGKY
ncbi:unnamed protein product, partial [Owenia fusiformis]